MEIQKARKGRELLDALSSRNIYQAKRLLNQELNPHCWKRTYNEEIETPLSLIIESCLRTITRDKEEVLTKLLKHKELDFSQIKPIQAIEKNQRLKQIITQAVTERLTDAINRKDLNDVKELLEDNYFMNRAIVTTARRDINDLTEPIEKYLNEKFPANTLQPSAGTNNVPVYEYLKQGKVDRQARTGALVSQEMIDQPPLENERFRTKGLNNINQKSLKVSAPGRNYASAFFVLSGAFAVGACLTIPNLEICIPLAVTAFAFFTIGCYCSYKANTALSDVKSTQVSVQRSGRIR